MAIVCSYGLKIKTLFRTRIFLICSYTIVAIPTTLLNLSVLVAIWKTPSLHKPSQILLASLAFTDLLVGIIIEPSTVYGNLAIINEWGFSYCNVWIIFGPFAFFLVFASLSTLAIISVDRYLAIKLKFSYRTVVTTKRTICVLCASLFIVSSSYAVGVILLFHNKPRSIILILVIPSIVALLCLITLFYSMAFYRLRKTSLQVSSNNNNNDNSASNEAPNFNINRYRNSLHTMVIVLFAIFICYLPYFFFATLESLFKEVPWLGHSSRIGEFFAALNSLINPILYLWRMTDLRQAVKDTVKKLLEI